MRNIFAPWYIHVSANDDTEIRNNKGEIVFAYYNHDEGWCDRAIECGVSCPLEFPGADPDVIAGGAEALKLLEEVLADTNCDMLDDELIVRAKKLLEKVDKRNF